METVSRSPAQWLSQVNIRHCRQEDLPALEWDGEFTHFRRVYAEAYQRQLYGLSVLWVAEHEEAGVIGQVFVQLKTDRRELADGVIRGYLYSFRIRPEYRSMGLGSAMLQVLEDDLSQRGFRFVTLNVAKDNDRARELYLRRGYRVVAHEPGKWSYYDHEGRLHHMLEPAWRMEKRLG